MISCFRVYHLNVYTCTSVITMSIWWSTDISPTRDELGTSYSLGSTATLGSSVHADALVLVPQVSVLLSTDSSSLYDWMISPCIVGVSNCCRHQQEKNKSNATEHFEAVNKFMDKLKFTVSTWCDVRHLFGVYEKYLHVISNL